MSRRYLDTCVLRLAYEAKEDERTRRALEELNNDEAVFLYSRALELELLPMPTKNKRQGELDFYMGYFESAEYIECTEEALQVALDEGCRHGMHAIDAMHVGIAKVGAADEFVTAERPTKPPVQATTVTVRSIY